MGHVSTADLNGTRIAFTDSGPVDGATTVVFSHGLLMDHTMFDPQVAAFAGRHRVIAWDERAHGGTRAPGPFSYWDSAADLWALLDHLGVERAVLAGMSQGGFVSLRAALSRPDRVDGLILMGSQAGVEDAEKQASYDLLHEVWTAQGPAPVQEVVASIILGEGDWGHWFARWSEWAAAYPGEFTHAFRCLSHRDDITGRLGEITCPALVIHGTADAAIPMERAEAMAAGLGGSVAMVRVDGGTHAVNLTHPEPVNEAIAAFLTAL
jgi:pimeloyl-ACP methyl ester carboxylesterase